jgi:hypothetical protein
LRASHQLPIGLCSSRAERLLHAFQVRCQLLNHGFEFGALTGSIALSGRSLPAAKHHLSRSNIYALNCLGSIGCRLPAAPIQPPDSVESASYTHYTSNRIRSNWRNRRAKNTKRDCVCRRFHTSSRSGNIVVQYGQSGRQNGTLSMPADSGSLETETADDFVLGQNALISGATFIGLLPSGAPLSSITNIEIELYHVFPVDSTTPPDGRVLTRTNSPSDNQFAAFDSGLGSLSFSASVVSPTFTVANSVVNGIHSMPNQFTGGEGAGDW